ncbi:hypothetical protein OHB41_10105 [Streptomyces sp. NBC_01571]|uniref:hypothetical protein n=1 Tax=Streptomyces sp. NBC_01571 TaxID=2975883 RepID=UPI00225AED3B|nr:hypothetical protein [Streptomyces sp. NBC_01571]MCX4573528.1 hypothetical protein [Streptomyces sp. NBC_01571]
MGSSMTLGRDRRYPQTGAENWHCSGAAAPLRLHTDNQMGIATCCRLLGHPGIEPAPFRGSIAPSAPMWGATAHPSASALAGAA